MKTIAETLLEIGAVSFSLNPPFTLSSGLKSPIYCDNRLNISYIHERNIIVDTFIQLIRAEFSDVDVIAGVSTGGIAWAAWIAEELSLPMVYIRGEAKGHGKGKRVEGVIHPQQKIVIIEDLFSTGKGSLQAVDAIEEETEGEILSIIAIVSYELDIMKFQFSQRGLVYRSLETFENLLTTAIQTNHIPQEYKMKIIEWQKNPQEWNYL